MPTYTYQCTECGHQFDLFHSVKDESPKSCPECGAEAKRRIGAGVGLIFKGSGFYITDYKNGHSSMPTNGEGHNGSNGHSESTSGTAKEPQGDSSPKMESKKTEPVTHSSNN